MSKPPYIDDLWIQDEELGWVPDWYRCQWCDERPPKRLPGEWLHQFECAGDFTLSLNLHERNCDMKPRIYAGAAVMASIEEDLMRAVHAVVRPHPSLDVYDGSYQ